MTSAAWDSTHGQRRWVWHAINAFGQHTVEQRRAWHAIIAYRRQTRSNDVKCDMPLLPLDSTHGRMTSGRAGHHRLWAAHTIERRRSWHEITAFGQHTRSNDVGRDMPSLPLDITHGRQRRSWHDISTLEQHAWSDDIGHGMSSPPLGSTHGRTTSGVA